MYECECERLSVSKYWLWWTGDLSRVHPASCVMTAGLDSITRSRLSLTFTKSQHTDQLILQKMSSQFLEDQTNLCVRMSVISYISSPTQIPRLPLCKFAQRVSPRSNLILYSLFTENFKHHWVLYIFKHEFNGEACSDSVTLKSLNLHSRSFSSILQIGTDVFELDWPKCLNCSHIHTACFLLLTLISQLHFSSLFSKVVVFFPHS